MAAYKTEKAGKSKATTQEKEFGPCVVKELGQCIKYLKLMEKCSDFPDKTTMRFSTGFVLVGASGLGTRCLGYVQRNKVNVHTKSLKNIEATALDMAFANAKDMQPCVLLLTEFDRLSSSLEVQLTKLVGEIDDGADRVVTVGVTEDKDYKMSDELDKCFYRCLLTEANV